MDDEEQLIVLDSNNGWTLDMKIYFYNSKLNNWDVKKIPAIWNDRRDFGLVLIRSTMIFAGGCINTDEAINEVLCLNLQTMKFYENPPMLQARAKCALAELKDDVYAIGGLVNGEWSNSVEKYNFAIGKWLAVASLISSMIFVTVVELDGFLYAIDGQNSHSMECYDSAKNRWSRKAALTSKLQHVNIIGFAGFLYAISKGYTDNGAYCITMERYDPSKNSWETKQSPRYGGECVVLKNRLLTCGQIDAYKKEYAIEEYNLEANKWHTLTNLTTIKKVNSIFTLRK